MNNICSVVSFNLSPVNEEWKMNGAVRVMNLSASLVWVLSTLIFMFNICSINSLTIQNRNREAFRKLKSESKWKQADGENGWGVRTSVRIVSSQGTWGQPGMATSVPLWPAWSLQVQKIRHRYFHLCQKKKLPSVLQLI